MNPELKIRKLTIAGPATSVEYEFSSGVNLIIGPTGTGKTSMLQLIRWAIGANAVRSAAVREGVLGATVDLEINGTRLQVRRERDSRTLEVIDHRTASVVATPIAAGATGRGQLPMSDFMLEVLGIPRIDLPRARSLATRNRTTISFWDVLDYLYVTQSEMDTSIVHHTDPIRDPKRRATFELLYGLVDEDSARLERFIGELRSELADQKRIVAGIKSFLSSATETPEGVLRLEAERLDVEITSSRAELDDLKRGARRRTSNADDLRSRAIEAEEQVAGLARGERGLAAEVARFATAIAQLDVELERLERGGVALEALSPIDYRQCPRCRRRIDERPSEPGLCVLCLQVEPPELDPQTIEAERERILAQVAETERLKDDTAAEHAKVIEDLARESQQLAQLQAQINERTNLFVSEHFEAIAAATRTLEQRIARREAVSRSLELYDRLRERSAKIPQLERSLAEANAELGNARGRLAAAREKIAVLSSIFDDLLKAFRYPWYPANGTWIDPNSYLPVAGQDTFDEASGGMRTLLNVAYNLAGLRYGLQYGNSRLPLLGILDSPRKNLGLLADRDIGQNMYRRIRALHDAFASRFQLLIAENDPPPLSQGFSITKLTYEQPFIPWVHHPGPAQVTPIER
jgi:hypothetical protein